MTSQVTVRNTIQADIEAITALCLRVYPTVVPWTREQLMSHLSLFPEGQLVAVLDDEIVGMASSLVMVWDDYEFDDNWADFTASGMFTNHDPDSGRTLYGAEVMVDPGHQGHGIGTAIYAARESLCRDLGLRRIRAGARLRGYSAHAEHFNPADYVAKVVKGDIFDATLSFQLRRGFSVVGLVSGYLKNDPESLGHAAVIEWQNIDDQPRND